MNKVLMFLALLLAAIDVHSQIVERERPSEWEHLVEGARFMDRFLPMPEGVSSEGIWGTDAVQHRYVDNGIEDPEMSFWGGNILQTSDGKYHLYVCGWPEDSPKGHMFWRNSTVFHATCDNSIGPFRIENTVGKGHNPEAFRLKDGRVVVYVIDGYYIADKEDSRVWTYGTFQFDPRDRKIIEGLSNLTFAQRQDDSYLMVCRGGGVWISKDGLSPYEQITDARVYPAVEGRFEDPVVWRDNIQYHLIVNDWLGRIAFYQRSKDGIHWVTEHGEAYVPGVSFHHDGAVEPWFKYERLKILQDEYGRAVQANFAVIDTLKWEDLPNDRHSSKNISIPLNKGLLLEVLNKKEITASTKHIELRIKAEDGFYPQTDLDVESLRFGSYAEVNFGRGSKSVRSRIDGKDLIVTFDGKESGITSDEFAPKLIGKDKAGKMVFGYAALPYVDYNPPILSACKPEYEDGTLKVEVKNFGLSDSVPAEIEVFSDGLSLGMASVGKLMPYETQIVAITDISLPLNPEAIYEVVFQIDGKEIERNKFEYIEKK